MAEVHEITRTAFNQLLAFPDMCEMLCKDWETPDTEWYLASIWAHFGGKSHFVWVYPAACEREAVKDADNENERQLRTVATYEKDGRSLHCAREYEVWHIVDDEPEPDNYGLYQRYALEAYLGDFVEEYDIDAIEDAVTVLDYSTGNRYWIMDDEELAEYIAGLNDEPEVHPIEKVELPTDSNGMYLHVGDVVRECGWQTVYRVNSLRLEREGWLVMYSVTGDNRGLYGRWAKDLIRLDTREQHTAER